MTPRNPSALPASFQPGIFAPVPAQAGYLFLSREAGARPAATRKAIAALTKLLKGQPHVAGLSAMLVASLGAAVGGLRAFPFFPEARVDLPVTQSDLWIWLRGKDQGELFHDMRELVAAVAGVLKVDSYVQAFRHKQGNDLTGFEDGTANPKGVQARKAAFAADGSSFVAVQRWEHRFERFDAMSPTARNAAIGRDLVTNEELPGAPETAHVKRTEQEDFDPEAFVLRRSMPWAQGAEAGLMFVAFGCRFDAFEAQLRRMSGAEDGKVDGLFEFTRPLGGGYYWCPPVGPEGALDLSALG